MSNELAHATISGVSAECARKEVGRLKCLTKTVARLSAPLSILLIATACHGVAGTALPAPGLAPVALTGEKVKQVLLDADELAILFDQSFKSDPDNPPSFGGADQLGSSWASATPAECAGVPAIMQQTAYPASEVHQTASESWLNFGDDPHAQVVRVDEGVVALPTVVAAAALFDTFVAQWAQCDGVTVDRHERQGRVTGDIFDVENADSVLSAVVEATIDNGILPIGRAVGVRANCLVDINVIYHSGTDDFETTARDVAQAMMGKITDRT